MSVPASLRAFLSGIVDYAGLFPPAQLPLDEAIRNYARYRTEAESWMLGRFICPASRLHELHRFQDELFEKGPPFAFSVLGRGAETSRDFLAAVERDVADIERFRGQSERLQTQVYEVKLPEDLLASSAAEALARCIQETRARLQRLSKPLDCFFEAGILTPNGQSARQAIGMLSAAERSAPCMGFKMRCGGVAASAFPNAGQLSAVLANNGLTLKCTAGLHHPLHHWDSGVQVNMHGFVNVFGAGMLARKYSMSEQDIVTIIQDGNPASFSFTETSFRWKELELTTREIAQLREQRMTSFGSCSFDEPREDLKRLGWM